MWWKHILLNGLLAGWVTAADFNQIRNPGFEAGLDHWAYATQSALDGCAMPVIATNAVEGGRVLQIQLPEVLKENTSSYLSADCIPLTGPGTFSVYLRSTAPVRVTLGMQVGNAKNDVKSPQAIEIGNDWKRLALTWDAVAPYGQGTPWIGFESEEAGVMVEVDAAQFVWGEAQPFESPKQIQCGFYTDIRGGILHPGQQAVVGFDVVFPDAAAEPVEYELRCADQDGAIVMQETLSLNPTNEQFVQVRRNWIAPEVPGLYRWTVRRQGVTNSPSFGSYELRSYSAAVVRPPHPAEAGKYNFFSTCITPTNYKMNTDRARALGMTLMRLHFAISLGEMNSFQPGLPLDQLIDYPHRLGLSSYIYLLDHHHHVANATRNPAWLDRFKNFCKTIFSYYEGKIHACEFWNEPSYKLDLDQLDAYRKIQKAIQEAKSESGAKLTLVDISGVPNGQPHNQEFIDRVAASPQTKHSDAVALHFYMNGRRPETLLPVRMNSIQSVRDNLPDKALWDSESGYITRPDRPLYHWMWAPENYQKKPWESSHWTVRQNLMEMQLGVKHKTDFLISGINIEGRYFSYGMFEGDAYGSARLRVVSYAAMSRLLAHVEPVSLRFTDRYGSYAAEFIDRKTGRTVLALWQTRGEKNLPLNIPENFDLFDVYGREMDVIPGTQTLTLSEGPVYLVCERSPELPKIFRLYDLLCGEKLPAGEEETVALPPNPEWVLRAADCGFMLGFEPYEELLQIDMPVSPKSLKNILVWDLIVEKEKAGTYVVWGAVDSMFSAARSDLTFQLDDQPVLHPQAIDQPLPVSVTMDGEPMILGWEKLAQVELNEGHHQFKVRAEAKQGRNRLIQSVGGLAICLKATEEE